MVMVQRLDSRNNLLLYRIRNEAGVWRDCLVLEHLLLYNIEDWSLHPSVHVPSCVSLQMPVTPALKATETEPS